MIQISTIKKDHVLEKDHKQQHPNHWEERADTGQLEREDAWHFRLTGADAA